MVVCKEMLLQNTDNNFGKVLEKSWFLLELVTVVADFSTSFKKIRFFRAFGLEIYFFFFFAGCSSVKNPQFS